MGIKVSASGNDTGKKFEKPTEMIQQAVLADIVDKGEVPNKYKPGTTQHKIYFVWILEEKDTEGRNKRAFDGFNLTVKKAKGGKESNLRKRLKEFGAKFEVDPNDPKQEVIDGQRDVELEKYLGLKRTLVMSAEDSDEPGGDPFIKILATQKPQGAGVDVPADFVRKQDQAAQ